MRIDNVLNVLKVLDYFADASEPIEEDYRRASAVMKMELVRLQRRRSTKFYLIGRLADYLRKHHEDFETYSHVRPTARVEEMLAIIEDEGGVG